METTAQQKQLKTHRDNKVKVTLQEEGGGGQRTKAEGETTNRESATCLRSDVMRLQVRGQVL